MALYYLDTSALTKLYVRESGTDRMFALARGTGNTFAVLTLARVELYSAIRRRQREGLLASDEAETTLRRINGHFQARFGLQSVDVPLIEMACALASRHPLRAYDAMQLAGALAATSSSRQRITFVCSDAHLLEAARGERLEVMDPAADS